MKKQHPLSLLLRAGFAAFALLAVNSITQAKNLYYDGSLPSGGWFGASNWSSTGTSGPFNQNWSDNNIANFNFGGVTSINLSGTSVAVDGINVTGATTWITSSASAAVDFSGGNITGTGSLSIQGLADLSGTLTKTSTGAFFMNAGTGSFSGTFTNSAGSSQFNSDALSASSNFVVTGGTLGYEKPSYANAGHVTLNGGNVSVGTYSSGAVSATFNSLQGTGGALIARQGDITSISNVTVNQDINTEFSGTIKGVEFYNAYTYLTFAKSGTGTLTISGNTINLRQGTEVNAGTLLINGGTTRDFENLSGSAAITVADGGTLGGTSTLDILGGDDVVVEDGGSLAAGDGVGTAGRSTFDFATGGDSI